MLIKPHTPNPIIPPLTRIIKPTLILHRPPNRIDALHYLQRKPFTRVPVSY